MQGAKVSIYKNVLDTEGKSISISTILKAIKNGRWKDQIIKLRNIKDEKVQKAYKNTLPCFTGSGAFSSRKTEGLIAHSGIMILDFDAEDNPQINEKQQDLIADKHTAFLFNSCRGNGFAVGVRIDGSRHAESFHYLEDYYKKTYGLVIDKGCKDVTRLRFISYDLDLYASEGAETVIVPPDFLKEIKHRHVTPVFHANDKNHEIMRAIIASGELLGDDSHDEWVRIAFALVSTFGAAGRAYFHELSKLSPKYDPIECDEKYDNCLRTNQGNVTFGTVIHLAREAGIDLPGNPVTEVTEVTVSPEELISNRDFPIDVFPNEFQKLISDVSASMDISVEVSATIALTILSASVGNALRISPKHDYYVAPFLWAGIVLPPGTAKSPTINMLASPIKGMQSKAFLRHEQEMQEYESKLNAFNKDKTGTVEKPEVPRMEQFYVSDSTVEALADVFESQPRGVLNYQDELSGLIWGMDQYKAKGNDRQHFLDLWNCYSWKIDRKGKPRFIPNVGMGIIGGIQPMVLTKVFGDDSFHDGFIYRFIFVCPESRPLRFNRKSVNERELAYWEALLYWCFGIPVEFNESGFVKSKILSLNDGALNLWEKFYNEYGQLATVLPSKVSGFIPKLYLYSLKIAGLLHILDSFGKKHIVPTINEKTIQDAIKLTEYYLGQVGKVLKLYGSKKELNEQHKRIVDVIRNLQGEVTNSKLELSKIVEGYNRGLPKHAHLTAEKMSNVLNNELGLTTKRSTGNYSCLVWEDEKMKNLFRTTLTTLTTLTILTEIKQGGVDEVKEVNEVKVDCEEIPEIEFMEEVK